jgi:phage terminase small subunit
MTHRQKKLLEELPKNNNILSKAAIKAGYSPSYATSELYQDIRKPTSALRQYFNENTCKRDIKKAKKLALKKDDLTNYLRATELESKILGLQLDRSEVKNVNPERVTIVSIEKSTNRMNIDTPSTNNMP